MKPQWSIKEFAEKYGFDSRKAGNVLGGSKDAPTPSFKKGGHRLHQTKTSHSPVHKSTYDHDEMLAWLKKHGFVKQE